MPCAAMRASGAFGFGTIDMGKKRFNDFDKYRVSQHVKPRVELHVGHKQWKDIERSEREGADFERKRKIALYGEHYGKKE